MAWFVKKELCKYNCVALGASMNVLSSFLARAQKKLTSD